MTDLHEAFEHAEQQKESYDKIMQETDVAPKERALDIFALLNQSDKQNFEFFNTLTEQGKKEFSVWVIQRWLANRKLELVNEITNPLINSVPKELAWRLFCAIGTPGVGRYKWDAPPKKISGAKKEIILTLIAQHFCVSSRVAKTYLPLLSDEQILEIADFQGLEKKEITQIKKALK